MGADVPNLDLMFEGASSFNGDLSNWNTASITSVLGMFAGATEFEARGLENWEVASITTWTNAFHDTPSISACTKRKLYDAWSTSSSEYFPLSRLNLQNVHRSTAWQWFRIFSVVR